MPFCGYKLSICCSLLSVFAVVMLSVLGILFHFKSVTFIEDLSLEEENFENLDQLISTANVKYHNAVLYHDIKAEDKY